MCARVCERERESEKRETVLSLSRGSNPNERGFFAGNIERYCLSLLDTLVQLFGLGY